MNIRIAFTLLLIHSTAVLASNDTVSLAHVQPYTATFEYFLDREDGSREQAGTWSDAVHVDAQRIVRTVSRMPVTGGTDLVRTVVADRQTLAPLHLTQQFGVNLAGFYHSQVQDGRLTQVFTPDHQTPARIASAPIPSDVSEVNLQGLFAAALPLGVDSQHAISTYRAGADPRGETQVFEVKGQETITLGNQHMDAWKVLQPQTGWTYWVRKEFPYLVKVSHPAPGGGLLVSHIVTYEQSGTNQLSQ